MKTNDSINGGKPQESMVYFMEDPKIKWMMTGGKAISGNLQMEMGSKCLVMMAAWQSVAESIAEANSVGDSPLS